jgi:hypothetical protein
MRDGPALLGGEEGIVQRAGLIGTGFAIGLGYPDSGAVVI